MPRNQRLLRRTDDEPPHGEVRFCTSFLESHLIARVYYLLSIECMLSRRGLAKDDEDAKRREPRQSCGKKKIGIREPTKQYQLPTNAWLDSILVEYDDPTATSDHPHAQSPGDGKAISEWVHEATTLLKPSHPRT